MDEGATKGQLLFHAARQFTGRTFLEGHQLFPNWLDDGHVLADGALVHGGEEDEVLLHGQVGIEGEGSGQVADAFADFEVLLEQVAAEDGGGAAVGQQQSGQDVEERGLACAVRTDHTENFALLHIEGDPFQGLDMAVALF